MMPRVISTCSALTISFCVAAAHAQPDLAVRSVDAAGVVGDWQALTISGSVDVEVANVGGAGAPAVPLIVFEDRDGSGSLTVGDKVLGVAQTPALGLLGKVVLTVPVSGDLRFRDNLIFAVVDPDNLNGESAARRANNVGNSAASCADPIPSVPFSIAFKGEWPGEEISHPDSLNILTTPMVADLDGDGLVEIIFVATDSTDGSALTAGVLRVISGDGLFEVFTISEPNLPINATAPLAIGDLDGDGLLEIIAVSADGRHLIAFEYNGVLRWVSPQLELIRAGGASIADLDGDGAPEIVIGRQVLSNGGDLLATGTGGAGRGFAGPLSVVADINRDGVPEIVAGNTAYVFNGGGEAGGGAGLSILWQAAVPDGLAAVADFDLDGLPEVVLVGNQSVRLLNGQTGALLWESPIPLGGPGGPPVVADVDGDGLPNIAVAGSFRFVVYRGDGTILWQEPISDISSGVAAGTVFDFNGDGAPEVVFRDEGSLYVFAGAADASPRVLFQAPVSSCTWYENPVVVDLDNDGAADLVVPANNNCSFGPQRGLKVYHGGDTPWVAARGIWNQHSYHFTNVEDDGGIPSPEADSWLTPDAAPYNAYRVNPWQVRPVSSPLPDLTASRIIIDCDTRTAVVRIGNGGSAAAPAGVPVAFYGQTPQPGHAALSVLSTPTALAPGQFVELAFDVPPAFDFAAQSLHFVADDSGGLIGLTIECDETNNAFSGSAAALCPLSFVFFPADVVVNASVDITNPGNTGGAATAADSCGNDAGVSFADDPTSVSPPFPLLVTRTWRAENSCGIAITRTQRITLVEETAPLSLACAAPVSVALVEGAEGVPVEQVELPLGISGGQPPYVATDNRPVDVYPLGTTVVTFTVMDAIGNMAECEALVTVLGPDDSGQPRPDIDAEERRITTTTRNHGCGLVGLFPVFACVAGLGSMKAWQRRRR